MLNTDVWEVYDLWRTSKLNVKYYSSLQVCYTRLLSTFDLVIAATAPSGTIAALWFWDTQLGSIIWKVLIIIASVVALIKPTLNLTEKIKKTDTVLSGYKMMCHDLDTLIIQIKHSREYDESKINTFNDIYKRKGVLISQDPEINANRRKVKLFTDNVNKELQNYDYYIPEE